jgi:hypothetical protein
MPSWGWFAGGVFLVAAYVLMFSMAAVAGQADVDARRAIVDRGRRARRASQRSFGR